MKLDETRGNDAGSSETSRNNAEHHETHRNTPSSFEGAFRWMSVGFGQFDLILIRFGGLRGLPFLELLRQRSNLLRLDHPAGALAGLIVLGGDGSQKLANRAPVGIEPACELFGGDLGCHDVFLSCPF